MRSSRPSLPLLRSCKESDGLDSLLNHLVQKFFKESTLEEQEFVQSDDKKTVAEHIKSVDPEAKVVAFKRFSLSD